MIMPGSYKGLIVADRWCGLTPSDDIIEDLGSPDFGLPKYYNWNTETGGCIRVHNSRVLRFIGRELPSLEKYSEQHWGASEIEVIFDELKKVEEFNDNSKTILEVLKKNEID